MKKQRQSIINSNLHPHEIMRVLGKRCSLLLICGMLFCGIGTGCGAAQESKINREENAKEEMQDMENAGSGITGMIVVGSREEQEAADQTVQELFKALEAGDEKAIRELFSPYARENAADLDEKIRELIAYYPGANGGYTGNSVSTESKRGKQYLHVLDITLTVTNDGQEYQINICLQMKNDFEPSKKGVHSIEIIREEEKSENFKWKEKEDAPGVYVAE